MVLNPSEVKYERMTTLCSVFLNLIFYPVQDEKAIHHDTTCYMTTYGPWGGLLDGLSQRISSSKGPNGEIPSDLFPCDVRRNGLQPYVASIYS